MVLGVAWCCVVLTLGKQHSDRVSRLAVFAVFKHVVGLCKHPFWGALLRLQHAERASSGDKGKQGQFARLRLFTTTPGAANLDRSSCSARSPSHPAFGIRDSR
jgi:hypothetical protein